MSECLIILSIKLLLELAYYIDAIFYNELYEL